MKIGETIKIFPKGKQEKGGKILKEEDCKFEISKTTGVTNDKKEAIKINLKDKDIYVGDVVIEECDNKELNKDYVQLRLVVVEPEYQGGNAVIMLYKKSIEYAESLGKKLLFDSTLTIGAYKSFKKLENFGYKVIENPEMKFDGSHYKAEKSWTLRVERQENKE